MIKDSETFKTDDTPLAAYLVTEGYQVLDIIFNGSRAYFLFANDDQKFQQFIKDFQLLRATSNAAQLIFNYQELVKRTRRGF